MRAILLLLLLTVTGALQAQQSLDSALSVWKHSTADDSSKWYALESIVQASMDQAIHRSDLAKDLVKDAFSDAQELKLWRAHLNQIHAEYFYDTYKYSICLPYTDEGIQGYAELNHWPGVARLTYIKSGVEYARDHQRSAAELIRKSLALFEQQENVPGQADCYLSLAVISWAIGDPAKAITYSIRAVELYSSTNWRKRTAHALHNLGYNYQEVGALDSALKYYQISLDLSREIGNVYTEVNALAYFGETYQLLGEFEKARAYLNESLKLKAEHGIENEVSWSTVKMGEGWLAEKHFDKAVALCQEGYELAIESKERDAQRWALKCLYDGHRALGNADEALKYFELWTAMNDSMNFTETALSLQNLDVERQKFADSLSRIEEQQQIEMAHQQEVMRQSTTRNYLIAGGVLVLLIAIGLWARLKFIGKSKEVLQQEKDRSENLLLNILPADVAAELKANGKADARNYDMVSILFTDFKGFTEQSAKLSATDLVAEINTCFEAFDAIMEQYQVEKIKTIGDAYMAAGGLPIPTENSGRNTVLAALEMQAFIGARSEELGARGLPFFEMRVGIHTGPVVAGIVGVKKFQYDIWGDTVNTASRMESAGEVGKVNVSQATYELLKDDAAFVFESRGKIEAKGKGEIEMWFVQLASIQ